MNPLNFFHYDVYFGKSMMEMTIFNSKNDYHAKS